MKEDLKNALIHQANHEFFAAQSYEALALWCAEHDFPGFADFFKQQAVEEREHAHRFLGHLMDRRQSSRVTEMAAPRAEFENLAAIAQHAEALELENTQNIHSCYRIAANADDFASLPFLLEFIEEQVEEEAWAGSMVTLTQRAECPGAQMNLDRHINKILGEDE